MPTGKARSWTFQPHWLRVELELPSPVDENLRWKQKEIRKLDSRTKVQALGLRLKGDVADIHEDEPSPVSLIGLLASLPNDAAGLRDRAMISTGYDAGLRRSELVRIDLKHIERLPTGEAALFVPRSKTEIGRAACREQGCQYV